MYVIATVICPNFHFSVSPHVPFLNLLFEQIANSNEYLVFACKIWRRYSRERALKNFKFHSHPGNLISYLYHTGQVAHKCLCGECAKEYKKAAREGKPCPLCERPMRGIERVFEK